MKRTVVTTAMCLLTILFLVVAAQADTIPGLYNTGVDSAGIGGLRADDLADLHYSLMLPSSAPAYVVAAPDGFPIPPWIGNGPDSKWIAPAWTAQSGNLVSNEVGDYTYRTTFDLTGLDPNTAKITGKWTTDNAGKNILINGTSTSHTTAIDAFLQFNQTFTISSGFVAGINTLDFVVNNASGKYYGNPTGLRVELSGTADPVPEPATPVLLGLGLFGLGVTRRTGRKAGNTRVPLH